MASEDEARRTSPDHERHLRCSICSRLSDGETVTEYLYPDPNRDDPAMRLESVPTRTPINLYRCPECGTWYRFHHLCYEFLIGFGGSYDEYRLERLSDDAAKGLMPNILDSSWDAQ